jgi:DUF4097 and DUF4098 domain-containing protein YvlB
VNTLRFEPSPQIKLIQADADVAINGWDRPVIEVTLDGDLDQCTAEQVQGALNLTSHAALALHVPRATTTYVQQVSGDLLLRDLEGEVAIDTAQGDVSIRGVSAPVTAQEIHGSLAATRLAGTFSAHMIHTDLQLIEAEGGRLEQIDGAVHARSIAGDLELGEVGGDITVRGILGALKLERGHGSLQAHDLHSGLEVTHVAGDLSLKTAPQAGYLYRAQVGGEIRARFPAETSARFDLRSNSLVSARLATLEKQEPQHVIGQAGAGEAEVILQADGDVWVQVYGHQDDSSDAWETMDTISARIEAEIAQHLGKLTVDAATQREIDKALRKAEQELAQAQLDLERETQRAHERARRAQEKAAQAARRAQERIARKSRSWGVTIDTGAGLFGPPIPQHHREPKPPHVSTEEQLAILKMLQEGKISVKEAEELLKALEG